MEQLDAQIHALVEQCRTIASDRTSTLSLGHFLPEGDNLFYQAMYAFTSENPALRTDIRLPNPNELLSQLFEHRLDAVVLPRHILTPQEELRTVQLCTNPEYCIMSRNHPLADRDSITLADLAETVCLVTKDARCGNRPWHEHHLMKDGICEIRIQQSPREQLTNLRTQPSVMVSLYPMLFIDNELVRIPFSDGPLVTTVLAWLQGNEKPALEALIDSLPSYYQDAR